MSTPEHRAAQPDLPPLHLVEVDGVRRVATRYASGWDIYQGSDAGWHSHAPAYATDLGPLPVVVLPAPSAPVVRGEHGWRCGSALATDSEHVDRFVAEILKDVADLLAIRDEARRAEAPSTPEQDITRLEDLVRGADPQTVVAVQRIINRAQATVARVPLGPPPGPPSPPRPPGDRPVA